MELTKIVFATHNKHKAEELQAMLEGKYQVLTLDDIGCHEEIPEDADTLEGNAIIKAKFVADNYGVDCFADDTGLEVSALNGAPGVHTARYAGEAKDPDANMNKLLDALAFEKNRTAQFRTVICLIKNHQQHLFEGIAKGAITTVKSGSKGFGYDPIFVPAGYEVTFAEMTQDEKNRLSHRGRAVEKLISYLQNNDVKNI
ncbi:MAG: non-canonical purine NTP diphosphatase [Cryomorphaceae bacterium]|nr:non-canonical purine NTP diphosphatase [Cryomorphaceae bacterium]